MLSRALQTNPDTIGDTHPLGVVASAFETSLKKETLAPRTSVSSVSKNAKYNDLLTLLSSLGLSSASTRLVLGEAIL